VTDRLELPLFDAGQQSIGAVPAALACDTLDTPDGAYAALTLRVPNATVSVLLPRKDLGLWIAQLQDLHRRMPGLALPGQDF
jgi:hypothetical protein